MRYIFSLTLALSLIFQASFSQSLSPEVMATSGNHFAGTNAQISWTVGEPVITTATGNSAILTQGFHQTNLTITELEDEIAYEVLVYPNPASNYFNIEISGSGNEAHDFSIIDLSGKELMEGIIMANEHLRTVNIETVSAGTYFIRILSRSDEKMKIYKLEKIH